MENIRNVKISDLKNFLDEDGQIAQMNPEANKFARFLTEIIESASENYSMPLFFANTECVQIQNKTICNGEVEVGIYAEDNRIGWERVECEATGVISNWEGTIWDKRDYTLH